MPGRRPGCRSGCFFLLAFVPLLLFVMAQATRADAAQGWVMSKTSSQTLTASTGNTVTWDAAQLDSGEAVIDLAGERFVLPRTGQYEASFVWAWENPAPASATVQLLVGGSVTSSMVRQAPITTANFGSLEGTWVFGGTAGDGVTLSINPGSPPGVTARGNAALNLRSSFALIELAPPMPTFPTFPPYPTPNPSAPMTIDAFTGTALETVEAVKYAVGAGLVLVILLLTALFVVAGLRR